MARADLRRLLRGTALQVVQGGLEGADVRVEDSRGRTVVGDDEIDGPRAEVVVEGDVAGVVVGEDAAAVAAWVAQAATLELEKKALARETLDRYKELTLLYDLADKLGHVLGTGDVATLVVQELRRFVTADAAEVLLHDIRRDQLVPLAADGAPIGEARAADAVEEEVLLTGRAMALGASEDGPARVCTPLRSGDSVYGLVQLSRADAAEWSSGDLKLTAAIASIAAPALRHAQLHAVQLRQQAVRSQVDAIARALAAKGVAPQRGAAIAWTDLTEAAADGRDVVATVDRATVCALRTLLTPDATIHAAAGGILVAHWPAADGAGARTAVEAAQQLVHRLEAAGVQVPGMAVVATRDGEAVRTGLAAAALAHGHAQGRLVVDGRVASELDAPPTMGVSTDDPELELYEVRP